MKKQIKKHFNKIVSTLGIFKNLKNVNLIKMFGLSKFQKPTIIIVAMGLLIVSNIFISYASLRLDLSKGGAYTLSKATKALVGNIDKKLEMSLYLSNNIPARLKPIQREAIDILREYDRLGQDINLQIVEFDPIVDADTVTKVQQAGIYPTPIREQDYNEVSLTEIYAGLIVNYGDQNETIGEVLDVQNLEYSITSLLYRMTNDKIPQISVVGIPDSYIPQQDQLGALKQFSNNLFSIDTLTIPDNSDKSDGVEVLPDADFAIPAETDTLLVIDTAEQDFTDQALTEIDRYLQTGNAVFFINSPSISDNLQTGPTEDGLISLLQKYGLSVQNNIILSSNAEFVNMGSNGFSIFVPYPMWLWSSDFNSDAAYFAGIGRLTFPWASSIDVKNIKGRDIKEIIRTGKESWSQTGTFSLNPQQIAEPGSDMLKTFTIAAESSSKTNKIMAIGSSRFILSSYLSQQSQNLDFIFNVLSDYASDGALSGITSRAVNIYPLPELPAQVQDTYKYSNILLLPAIFAVFGTWRLWKRNKQD